MTEKRGSEAGWGGKVMRGGGGGSPDLRSQRNKKKAGNSKQE
jgi:hypothetical protein